MTRGPRGELDPPCKPLSFSARCWSLSTPSEAPCKPRVGRRTFDAGVLRRVLALTELKFSNSMIEAWWRSLKHQWRILHSLDSVTTTVRQLVTFYVDEHNRVLPHSAFRGKTPDEMYFGFGDTVPADL